MVRTSPGVADLLTWLETETDFFAVPASTKYHGARPGGLVDHSLNVYDELILRHDAGNAESRAVCALLHDICKANYYDPMDVQALQLVYTRSTDLCNLIFLHKQA